LPTPFPNLMPSISVQPSNMPSVSQTPSVFPTETLGQVNPIEIPSPFPTLSYSEEYVYLLKSAPYLR
jgi:hypothetical protein